MDIEVRPCASTEELRDALNVIGHYFGYENQIEDAERFAQWTELARVHVAFEGDRPIGVTGAFNYRMSVPGGDHGRRGPADASPARRAASTDAGAARRLPRARRPRSVPLGLGGNDLRSLRLRSRLAYRLDLAPARAHRLRRSVPAARDGPHR